MNKYRFSFDISGLVIFLIVMIPNFIWFAVPAPNDILRNESVTAIVDTFGSIFQVLFIECSFYWDKNLSNFLGILTLYISNLWVTGFIKDNS